MGRIRPLTPCDIAEVVTLHRRVFGAHPGMEEPALQAYFRHIFFEGPWRHENYPSLVYDEDESIRAFIGLLPRPMEFQGEPVQAVVATQFMAHPDGCPPLVPFQLLRQVFAGPQDLVISDGSTRDARRLWLAAGGSLAPAYDFHWRCTLRPARHFLARAGRKNKVFRAAERLASAPAGWADRGIRRILGLHHPPEPDLTEAPLTPNRMLAELEPLRRRYSLIPVYDGNTLAWHLEEVRSKRRHGPLRAVEVADKHEDLLGWYQAYFRPGGSAETLQLHARRGREEEVLNHLLHAAFDAGCVAVSGRFQPELADAIARARGTYSSEGTVALFQSRRPELLAAIGTGGAFLTRLEGEWWMRFVAG